MAIIICLPLFSFSQKFELEQDKHVQKVKFQLINNVVIVPIEVNGSKLSFILDTGVSVPILFNLTGQDSVQINDVSEVEIKGLGSEKYIKALSSKGNTFKIDKIKNSRQELFVVLDKDINFSTTFGIPVHGIIGYDLFKDFVVDINYTKRVIKFFDSEKYKPKVNKRQQVLPLEIINKKAYLKGDVFINDSIQAPVQLLVDTGSTDAVWLFEDLENGIVVPEQNYEDFLGKGLNGNVFGKRTKVDALQIGNSILYNAKVAFPKMEAFNSVNDLGNRNGSIGGEVLKRFNIVFNYPKQEIILSQNSNFKKPFNFNMSGIELVYSGMRFVANQITNTNGVVQKGEKEANSFGDVQILFEGTTRLSIVPDCYLCYSARESCTCCWFAERRFTTFCKWEECTSL